ncbi:MAG: hypothetical protein HFI13_13455, partial [Lachnospiraceae bacterium]|nr:hypothetical protein [Lachnospiraceae bacterium]
PPVGIPSDITVGLAVETAALTVPYSFFQTVAGTLFAFLCGSVDGRTVTGNGKLHEVRRPSLSDFRRKSSLNI